MALQLLLGLRQLFHLLGQLCIPQTQAIDLLPQLLLHVDVVLANLLEFTVFLLELGLSLRGNLFLDPQHFFEDVDVLLESAGDLLVLLQFFREENFYVAQGFELSLVIFADLLAGPLGVADQGTFDTGAL